MDGVKTGHTSGAGYVLVGAGHRDHARVISVVLGTPSESARDSETLELLRYGLGRFATITVHSSRTVKLVAIKDFAARAPLRPGHDLTASYTQSPRWSWSVLRGLGHDNVFALALAAWAISTVWLLGVLVTRRQDSDQRLEAHGP